MTDTMTPSQVDAPAPNPRRRWPWIIGALIMAGILLIGFVGFWYQRQVNPSGRPGAEVIVEIPPGTGVHGAGNVLADAGVIDSTVAYRVYTRLNNPGPIQAGQYELRKNMGIRDALNALVNGPDFIYEKLALPPGLTLREIAERVGELPDLSAERFLEIANSGAIRSKYQPENVNSLEGLTYPDTYFINKGETEKDILKRLVTTFDNMVDKIGLSGAVDLGITPYQAVIVASLIQTEAKLDDDRAQIASVIYNRLETNMLLQIDATILYARGNKTDPILNSDKNIDSPYNTYRAAGLPPTPISTVTDKSLEAALAPADTPYFYYVLIDESGKHAFATTLEEHEANIAAAREKGLLD